MEGPERKRARLMRTKQSLESEEEEQVVYWALQEGLAEENFVNVVWAMHSLAVQGVLALEEWRKEATAEQKAAAEDRRILRGILEKWGRRMEMAEKAEKVEAERKEETEAKRAEAEGMVVEVTEKGKEKETEVEAEVEKKVEAEDGEVEVESRLEKPEEILQASPGSPPSA